MDGVVVVGLDMFERVRGHEDPGTIQTVKKHGDNGHRAFQHRLCVRGRGVLGTIQTMRFTSMLWWVGCASAAVLSWV